MILKSMSIENYRPYENLDIDFAYGENNITIILGVNDSGKTSLLNAITWCLYDKEPFRDEGLEERWNKVKSEKIDINDALLVKVEIVMEDAKGRDVHIIRTQSYTKTAAYSCVSNEDNDLNIYVSKNGNNKKIKEPLKYLNNNLPESLQEYFMFTGEKLTQFFDKEDNQVKEGVHTLYQLDLLNKINENTKELETSYNNLFKRNNPKLAQLKSERSLLIEERDEAKERLKDNEGTINSLKIKIKKWESEIGAEGGNVEIIQNKINSLKSEKTLKENELEDKQDEYFNLLSDNFSKVLSYPLLKDFVKWEDFEVEDDVEEILVDAKEIKKILNRGECLCGNEFKKGDKYYNKLIKVLEYAQRIKKSGGVDVEDIVDDLLTLNENVLSRYPSDIDNQIIIYNQRINRLNLDINNINLNITDNELKLKKMNSDYINELLDKIAVNEGIIESLIKENGTIESDLKEVFPFAIAELDEKIKKAEKTLGKRNEYGEKRDFCERMKNISKSVYNELADEIYKALEEQVTVEYKKIHWKPEYKKIHINSDFEVFIEKTGGNLVSATDPSTGSRNILSLIFMAALNSLTTFVLPQVIDTPIASLSGNMRRDVAKYLPDYMEGKQMILLVMDTEYTGQFKSNIYEHVGKEYVLGYVGGEGSGKSIIVPFNKVKNWDEFNISEEWVIDNAK